MRNITLILLVLAFPLSAHAQLKVVQKLCVKNRSPGYCAWASIETLGNHHKIPQLKNLLELRSKESHIKIWDGSKWVSEPVVFVNHNGEKKKIPVHTGYEFAIEQKLKELKVKFTLQSTNSRSTDLIQMAIKNKLGCSVGFKAGAFGTGAHAITITDFNEQTFSYVDPNHPHVEQTWSRAWFDYWWSGYVLVIYP